MRLSFLTLIKMKGFPGGSVVKNPPANAGEVGSVLLLGLKGWEDRLEKETATHSSILAWKIPWTEKPCRLQSMGSPKSWTLLSRLTDSLVSL